MNLREAIDELRRALSDPRDADDLVKGLERKTGKAPKGKFIHKSVAYHRSEVGIAAPKGETSYTHPNGKRGWVYSQGWNGSYHDAQFTPHVVAWARGAHKMRHVNRMKKHAAQELAKAAESGTFSPVAARASARRQVRSGD